MYLAPAVAVLLITGAPAMPAAFEQRLHRGETELACCCFADFLAPFTDPRFDPFVCFLGFAIF